MKITMKNPKTGEVKEIKVGWSWTLFLFSNWYGLPLFLRRLTVWASFMFAITLASIVLFYLAIPVRAIEAGCSNIFLSAGMAIFFGIKGNEMTAKNYLELGWEFCNPGSDEVKMAKAKWGINI